MKTQLRITLLFCFLIISNLMIAQTKKDSTLITSRFLLPQFTDGIVLMKDGTSYGAKLNYDGASDQIQFLDVDNKILFIGEPDKVNNVKIGNRTFIYRKNYFMEMLISGPVSLYSRAHLQKLVLKNGAYGSSTATSSIQSLSSMRIGDGGTTQLTANENAVYDKEIYFYLVIKEKMKVIINEKELLKCFPSKKDLLKQELDKEQTNFKSTESMIKIVEWINANGIMN